MSDALELADVPQLFERWLAGRPLADRSRREYARDVRAYCAWLAETPARRLAGRSAERSARARSRRPGLPSLLAGRAARGRVDGQPRARTNAARSSGNEITRHHADVSAINGAPDRNRSRARTLLAARYPSPGSCSIRSSAKRSSPSGLRKRSASSASRATRCSSSSSGLSAVTAVVESERFM